MRAGEKNSTLEPDAQAFALGIDNLDVVVAATYIPAALDHLPSCAADT